MKCKIRADLAHRIFIFSIHTANEQNFMVISTLRRSQWIFLRGSCGNYVAAKKAQWTGR